VRILISLRLSICRVIVGGGRYCCRKIFKVEKWREGGREGGEGV
jgi:hypothetical protein